MRTTFLAKGLRDKMLTFCKECPTQVLPTFSVFIYILYDHFKLSFKISYIYLISFNLFHVRQIEILTKGNTVLKATRAFWGRASAKDQLIQSFTPQ